MEILLNCQKMGIPLVFAKKAIQQQMAILHNNKKFRSVVIILM